MEETGGSEDNGIFGVFQKLSISPYSY